MKKVCSMVGILQLVVVFVFTFGPPLHAQRILPPRLTAPLPVEMTQVELSAEEAEMIPEGLRAMPLFALIKPMFSKLFFSPVFDL